MASCYMSFGLAPVDLPAAERGLGIHAGEIETSLLLAAHAELVRRESVQAEFPRCFDGLRYLSFDGPVTVAWLTTDVSRSGQLGDARGATADKGERLLANGARQLIEIVRGIQSFSFDGRRDPATPAARVTQSRRASAEPA